MKTTARSNPRQLNSSPMTIKYTGLTQMSFRETSAKTNANVEETIESILLAIIKKGVMDVKKEKVVLAGKQEGCRNEENDTCCG